jgi:hypothetical protein
MIGGSAMMTRWGNTAGEPPPFEEPENDIDEQWDPPETVRWDPYAELEPDEPTREPDFDDGRDLGF